MTHVLHVSLKTVPFHLLHIHPEDGSNCIMTVLRGMDRTDSSMRSSSRILVDACSIMLLGVVKTMLRAVADDDDDDDEEEDGCIRCNLWNILLPMLFLLLVDLDDGSLLVFFVRNSILCVAACLLLLSWCCIGLNSVSV